MTEIDLNTPAGRQAARDAGLLVPDEVGQGVTYIAPDLGATAPEMAERISEKEWQWKVVNYAEEQGWRCYHAYDSRRSQPGFPDLICLRGAWLVVIELKVGKNKPTEAQMEWLTAFALLHGHTRVLIAYPSDWPAIEALLKRPEETCR